MCLLKVQALATLWAIILGSYLAATEAASVANQEAMDRTRAQTQLDENFVKFRVHMSRVKREGRESNGYK